MPNIIVIGASAGGVEPLQKIMRALPADLQAAIFVVMHLSPSSPSVLPTLLRAPGGIKVLAPYDGQPLGREEQAAIIRDMLMSKKNTEENINQPA